MTTIETSRKGGVWKKRTFWNVWAWWKKVSLCVTSDRGEGEIKVLFKECKTTTSIRNCVLGRMALIRLKLEKSFITSVLSNPVNSSSLYFTCPWHSFVQFETLYCLEFYFTFYFFQKLFLFNFYFIRVKLNMHDIYCIHIWNMN